MPSWRHLARTLLGLLLLVGFAAAPAPAQAATCGMNCIRGTVTPPVGVAAEDLRVGVLVQFQPGGSFVWSDAYPVSSSGTYEAFFPAKPTKIVVAHKDVGIYPDGTLTSAGGVASTYYDSFSGTVAAEAATVLEGTGKDLRFDVALQRPATLGGRVTFAPASAYDEASVQLERRTASGSWNYVGSRRTEVDGRYVFPDLAPGSYRVQFTSKQVSGFWPGMVPVEDAVPVVVAGTGDVSGIDGMFRWPSRISGTVTTESDVPVRGDVIIHARTGPGGAWQYVDEVRVQADGSYRTPQMPQGSYKLQFDDYSGALRGEWWKDSATQAGASEVVLEDGTDTTGIDFEVSARARVSGTVVSGAGISGEGFYVQAVSSDGTRGASAVTGPGGAYTLFGLDPGSYRVSFADIDELHLLEYWRDARLQDSATLVEVTELGQVITGVDAVMDIDPSQSFLVGPTIAGTPKVGSSLTASAGAYPSGGTTTFQWLANGIAVPGATSAGYIPTSADAGKVLSVRVQVSGYGLRSGSGTSAATAPVAPADSPAPAPTTTSTPTTPMPPSTATPAPVPTSAPAAPTALSFGTSGKPAVSGRAKVGTTLSVRRTGWSVDGAQVTYAWLADGKAIKKATKARLQLSRALVGKRISVRITATRGSERIVVRSRPTARVKA
jgi:hypothetical protein